MNRALASEEFAKLIDGETLVIQRWLPGNAARLWTYLVDAELRRKWLADGAMNPTPGAALELIWRNDDLSQPGDPRPEGAGGEHILQSKVIEAVAPERLVIAWGKGEVAFDLYEAGDKVRLTITHSGLDPSQTGVFAGWHSHLDILAAEISGMPPPSFWAGWMQLRDLYTQRIADPAAFAG